MTNMTLPITQRRQLSPATTCCPWHCDLPLSTLAQQREEFLLPDASIRDTMTAFERSEADVLTVIDRPDHRAAIGTVSEAHVLRTYGEELERRNQELFFR